MINTDVKTLTALTQGLLAMSTTSTLAAPRVAQTSVVHASDEPRALTKNLPASDAVESDLVGTIYDGRVTTVTRNQEFEEHMQAIEARIAAAKVALEREVVSRDAVLLAIREEFDAALPPVEAEFTAAVPAMFKRLRAQLPPEHGELDRVDQAQAKWYGETLPPQVRATFDDPDARISAAKQRFDLDQQTSFAREKAVWDRIEVQRVNIDKRHDVEVQDRTVQHARLDKQITDSLATAERAFVWSQPRITDVTKAIDSSIKAEEATRKAADESMLSTSLAMFKRVQATAEEYFAPEPEVVAPPPAPAPEPAPAPAPEPAPAKGKAAAAAKKK